MQTVIENSTGATPDDAPEHVHKDLLFRLTGKHPHCGEHAHPVGKSADSISTTRLFGGEPMYLLELTDCEHGTDRCYAVKADMQLVRETSQSAQSSSRPRRRSRR